MIDKTLAELAELLGLRYRIAHIPEWRVQRVVRAPNRPGRKRRGLIPMRDTTHGTANYNPGASALMHQRYTHGPSWGGPDKTSYHHVVDDVEAIELLPWEEIAYHGGTAESNEYWLGMEICENTGHYGPQTLENAAKLVACKMVKFGKPISWVVQHHAAYGKNCPGIIRRTPGAWQAYLGRIEYWAEELRTRIGRPPLPLPPPEPPVPTYRSRYFEEQKVSVGGAILDYFEKKGGVGEFGFPTGPETMRVLQDGREYTTQLFQRRLLHWRPGEEVGEGLLGAMFDDMERRHGAWAPGQ